MKKLIYAESKLKYAKEEKEEDGEQTNTEFYKNDEPMRKIENGVPAKITGADFESDIQTAVTNFINQSFENIVLLVGAGASVISDKSGVNEAYGKTVAMIAGIVAKKLKDGKYTFSDEDTVPVFTLNQLARDTRYASNSVYTVDECKRHP